MVLKKNKFVSRNMFFLFAKLCKHIFSVGAVPLCLIFKTGKVEEMRRPVNFMIKLFRVGQGQVVLHGRLMPHTHEVVVPRTLSGNHEKSEESVWKEHLDFFVVAGQVTLGVVSLVGVVLAPLEAAGGQLVGGQRARAGSEWTKRRENKSLDFQCW